MFVCCLATRWTACVGPDTKQACGVPRIETQTRGMHRPSPSPKSKLVVDKEMIASYGGREIREDAGNVLPFRYIQCRKPDGTCRFAFHDGPSAKHTS